MSTKKYFTKLYCAPKLCESQYYAAAKKSDTKKRDSCGLNMFIVEQKRNTCWQNSWLKKIFVAQKLLSRGTKIKNGVHQCYYQLQCLKHMASKDLRCHIRKEIVNEIIDKLKFFQSKFFKKWKLDQKKPLVSRNVSDKKKLLLGGRKFVATEGLSTISFSRYHSRIVQWYTYIRLHLK